MNTFIFILSVRFKAQKQSFTRKALADFRISVKGESRGLSDMELKWEPFILMFYTVCLKYKYWARLELEILFYHRMWANIIIPKMLNVQFIDWL